MISFLSRRSSDKSCCRIGSSTVETAMALHNLRLVFPNWLCEDPSPSERELLWLRRSLGIVAGIRAWLLGTVRATSFWVWGKEGDLINSESLMEFFLPVWLWHTPDGIYISFFSCSHLERKLFFFLFVFFEARRTTKMPQGRELAKNKFRPITDYKKKKKKNLTKQDLYFIRFHHVRYDLWSLAVPVSYLHQWY